MPLFRMAYNNNNSGFFIAVYKRDIGEESEEQMLLMRGLGRAGENIAGQ